MWGDNNSTTTTVNAPIIPEYIASESIPEKEWVNHPDHYSGAKFECIEVMEDVFGTRATKDFCLLNAFKYLYRCNNKHDSPIEDLNKTKWYIDKTIELINKIENDDGAI